MEYSFWDFTWTEIILLRSYKNIDKDTIFIKFWNANIGKNLGLFKKNNKNLNPFENKKKYKFWYFTWIEIILPISYKNIDKDTIVSSYFGMQISAKIWDYLKKIKKIAIPSKI